MDVDHAIKLSITMAYTTHYSALINPEIAKKQEEDKNASSALCPCVLTVTVTLHARPRCPHIARAPLISNVQHTQQAQVPFMSLL